MTLLTIMAIAGASSLVTVLTLVLVVGKNAAKNRETSEQSVAALQRRNLLLEKQNDLSQKQLELLDGVGLTLRDVLQQMRDDHATRLKRGEAPTI